MLDKQTCVKAAYLPETCQSSRKRRIRRIFTPTFGFLRVLFLLGILIYANFFSTDASQTP